MYKCDNASLSSVFIPDYRVTGADVERSVGETVTVNCAEDHQIFTEDR